jgi:hypothetical protein
MTEFETLALTQKTFTDFLCLFKKKIRILLRNLQTGAKI